MDFIDKTFVKIINIEFKEENFHQLNQKGDNLQKMTLILEQIIDRMITFKEIKLN